MMLRPLAAVLAAAAVGVAGCSGDPSNPVLSAATARQLQKDVLAVTQSAALHNWASAGAGLQKLKTDLAAARSAGTVSTGRASSIEASIAAVSSDLTAAGAPTRAPSTPQSTPVKKTPAPTSSPPKHKGPGHGRHGDG